jgi:hypothetical protein
MGPILVPNLLPNLTGEALITLVFLFIAFIYVVFSAVFYYHWISYSTDSKIMSLTFMLYGITTLPLVLLLATITFLV